MEETKQREVQGMELYGSERAYKEMLEGKERYANKRNRRDKENCETLTPEQHDVLAWLACVRHEVKKDQYCKKAWFLDECDVNGDLWKLIPNNIDGSDGKINNNLQKSGLNPIKWSFDPDDYLTESICYELGMDQEEREEEEEKTADMASKFNSDIISYLHGVDMENGTHYCPTGIAGDKNPNL